jgi:S-formylglutathione hydrolase FrmB
MPLCEFHYKSAALDKQTSATILLPDPEIPGPYPVMFLLHGLSDDNTIWARRTSIERYVEGLPLIVVMPDGGRGFYIDAAEGFAYGAALGVELPEILRKYFPTKPGWCITGLSMGGYGALRLALGDPVTFVSAVSHSGAVGFGHRPEYFEDPRFAEFRRLLGPNPLHGPNDLYARAQLLEAGQRPQIRFDCGVDDYLIEDNRAFHRFLMEKRFPHEYEEHPGAHTWAYWDLHVQEAIAFHARNLGLSRS